MNRLPLFAFLAFVCGSAPAYALDLSAYPQVRAFIDDVSERDHVDRHSLEHAFRSATLRDDILTAMERPKEALPWYEYKKQFVNDALARQGADYWERHHKALCRAALKFGVPPEVIVAILGVETHYGRNIGRYRALDALTTLWLKFPPRADFFRSELEQYFLLAHSLGVDPRTLKSSYAGALGIGQFMPSSYRLYAVDFDSDKKIDLMDSDDDAIGSVANYFHLNGWQTGQPIVGDAHVNGLVPAAFDNGVTDPPRFSVGLLREHGVVPAVGADDARLATLVSLQEKNGFSYRLGYQNFYVLTRYNRSKHYAMAVYELSRMIKRRYFGRADDDGG